MIDATQNPQNAKSEQVGRLIQRSLADNEPMWPVDTFLRADLYRLRGDIGEARAAYRALAEWGAKDPYNDGWGGAVCPRSRYGDGPKSPTLVRPLIGTN
jgi:hypothetical protein